MNELSELNKWIMRGGSDRGQEHWAIGAAHTQAIGLVSVPRLVRPQSSDLVIRTMVIALGDDGR